jgi:hypothetical protein
MNGKNQQSQLKYQRTAINSNGQLFKLTGAFRFIGE